MVRPVRGADPPFKSKARILNGYSMRRRNIIAAVALIVFSLIYGALTTQLPVRSLPNTPGPPFFPWVNTAILLALSIGLLVQGLRGTNSGDNDSQPPAAATASQRRLAAWALGAFVVYLIALPGLGFLLATTPFFAALMVLFGERRWLWVVIGSVATTTILYILFRHGFSVFLPRGILPDLIDGIFT